VKQIEIRDLVGEVYDRLTALSTREKIVDTNKNKTTKYSCTDFFADY